MKVRRFNAAEDKTQWDEFVSKAKGSTFLFHRSFMDYHSDRFKDHSILVIDDGGKIRAALPANEREDGTVLSHQGLTYGGFIFETDVKLLEVFQIVQKALEYLAGLGIQSLYYKHFPWFYNASPTDELKYIFFLISAELYRCDVAFVIDQHERLTYSGNIRREANKAERNGAIVKESATMDSFWKEILEPNLMQRFGVKPVHSLEEISKLKNSFPEQIKQYNVYQNGKLMAGTTLFITNNVVHCQYISASNEGRQSGCLNYLFKHLIDETFSTYQYFDFGIVNENEGKLINKGMLFWKESFGGRARKHSFYKIPTNSHLILAEWLNKHS